MTWFIILGFMLILIISGFRAHSIHIIFKIGSDTKAVPSWSFVNKINFQTLKELIKGLNKDKLILSPLGRQCEKGHVYTWMLHYYLEGIFHGQKRYNI